MLSEQCLGDLEEYYESIRPLVNFLVLSKAVIITVNKLIDAIEYQTVLDSVQVVMPDP